MAQDGKVGGVNASGGQGIVAGTGNTQINNWSPRAPLTSATLAALNPNAGAAGFVSCPMTRQWTSSRKHPRKS
jgi:hypothetical protein